MHVIQSKNKAWHEADQQKIVRNERQLIQTLLSVLEKGRFFTCDAGYMKFL